MHRVEEYVLKDVEGVEHHYVTETHPVHEGTPIAWTLLKAGAPAAIDAAIAAFGREGAESIGLGGTVGESLAAMDGPKFAIALLRRSKRDGVACADANGVSDAYAGNYSEMIEACARIVAINHFLPRLDTLVGMLAPTKTAITN